MNPNEIYYLVEALNEAGLWAVTDEARRIAQAQLDLEGREDDVFPPEADIKEAIDRHGGVDVRYK